MNRLCTIYPGLANGFVVGCLPQIYVAGPKGVRWMVAGLESSRSLGTCIYEPFHQKYNELILIRGLSCIVFSGFFNIYSK
jgi:hypothetical protein